MNLETSVKVYEILANTGITINLKIYKIFLSEKDKLIEDYKKWIWWIGKKFFIDR